MFLIERTGKAVLFVAFPLLGVLDLSVVFCACWAAYSAMLGDDSFEDEDIPITEIFTYSLPSDDPDLFNLEAEIFVSRMLDDEYDERVNC